MTDQEIETVARAICIGHGLDPDEMVVDENARLLSANRHVKRWTLLRHEAITQIAAFEACRNLYDDRISELIADAQDEG